MRLDLDYGMYDLSYPLSIEQKMIADKIGVYLWI